MARAFSSFSGAPWGQAPAPAKYGNLAVGVSLGSGYQHYFAALSTDQQNAEIAKMKAAGITWVRMDVDWSDAQPTATSPFGFHAPAYAEDRRSRMSPPPATSGITAAIGVRPCAPNAPSPGSRTPIEQRYDGIRSVTRTAPHNPENTSSERAARFFAAGSSEARSRAS